MVFAWAAALAASAPPPGAPSPPAVPALDSARAEVRAGRHWHAARLLRALGADTSADRDTRLLLVRAEAGWGNWEAVVDLMEGAGGPRRGAPADELHLLARALEETGRHSQALEAYEGFLSTAGQADVRRPAAVARLVRSAVTVGRPLRAVEALAGLPEGTPQILVSWTAVEAAQRLAEVGDTASVARLLALVRDPGAREAAWRAPAEARLAAGDTSGAEEAFLEARERATGSRRGEAAGAAGRLALTRGDRAAAWPLLLEALEAGGRGTRARAASGLLSFPDTDLPLTLRIAGALDEAADHGPALRAYDRAARLAEREGTELADSVRLARARLMSLVPARHGDALEALRAIRASGPGPAVGSRSLELWARLRERQGRRAEAATVRRWLLEEYPGSAEAAEVAWARGQEAEAGGDTDAALAQYRFLAANSGGHARAGQGRMREGQILLARGDREGAAAVYEAYLESFPDGRRWQEAAFWAARARMESGQGGVAREHLARLRLGDPVSYYAVIGSDLLGEPYALALAPGPASRPPEWVEAGAAGLALLEDAGLSDGVEAEEARLAARARGEPGALLALAEALLVRGRTVTAINLGWELRDGGTPWSRRLLAVVFPFPYREMIAREAAEWGLDPLLVASVIRQESAFTPAIRSSAGAVGLMQVLPSTGRDLARRLGPTGFQPAHLEVPDLNLHLGAAFFVDMSRRYAGRLPLVLAAYNAGPGRADRWRRFPGAEDAARFTESIPFEETRAYVKNIRRNVALYRVLYGEG